jgi:hypothetical protein
MKIRRLSIKKTEKKIRRTMGVNIIKGSLLHGNIRKYLS